MPHTDIVSVVVSLIIIELLMSVDNALVNATLAESLPTHLRTKALRLGIVMGAVLRIVALSVAAFIIQNAWVKIIGAFYLMYLTVTHVGKAVDEEGRDLKESNVTFFGVATQIMFADLVFSIDNVVSAVAFSNNIYLVLFGVCVGVITMLTITPILSRIIHRYKGMPYAAYMIVGFVGLSLFLETVQVVHLKEMHKFSVVLFIVLFTLWYEHSHRVRIVTTPWLKVGQYVLGIPVDVWVYVKRRVFGGAR